MKELDNRIDAWAEKVGIHESSTAMKQALYTLSETQELLVAVNVCDESEDRLSFISSVVLQNPDKEHIRDEYRAENQVLHEKIHEVADAIGDIYVTLKNVAHFYGLDMEECVSGAVKIIEDRANRGGGMVSGVYVKPEEE